MSVTVADVLKLPSFREAVVLAGRGGLSKIVSGISVLETIDPRHLTDGVFWNGDYIASELVVTGFVNCAENVELQCANLQRLAEGGEVGIALFYVGDIIPSVDPRLIQLADSLDFVLIQMPPGLNRRYGEVISDVSEYLYRDRRKDAFLVTDILARITSLPEHQRTINTILKLISERLLLSVILTDKSRHILNVAAWPGSLTEVVARHPEELQKAAMGSGNQPYSPLPNAYIRHMELVPGFDAPLDLFLLKEGSTTTDEQMEQAGDIVRLGVNLWGRSHSEIVFSELIHAIVQDDPIKMRRLADIFGINVQEIHHMWVLSGGPDSLPLLQENRPTLMEALGSCCRVVFSDIYDDRLILFTSPPDSLREAEEVLRPVLELLCQQDPSLCLFASGSVETTTEVRSAYLCYKQHLRNAQVICPGRAWFTLGDMEFAAECHTLISEGEKTVSRCLAKLRPLRGASEDWSPEETMAAFLLDAGSSITRTAALLHVHKNTVKYRLKAVSDRLGYRPDRMPDCIPLYRALAVRRLLGS